MSPAADGVAGRAIILLAIAACSAGCAVPCTVDVECPDDQHCAGDDDQRVCTRACDVDTDCGYDFACSARGKCTVGKGPHLVWVSPVEDARVDGTFDVEIDATFIGESLAITLDRFGENPGSPCGGFASETLHLPGHPVEETTHRVVFHDVGAAGPDFSLEVTAESQPDAVRFARRRFVGADLDAPVGIDIAAPIPGLVAAPALSVPIDVTVAPMASAVWARVVPVQGPPTPLRLLGEDTTRVHATRHAVALGPQRLEILAVQGGVQRTCTLTVIGVDESPPPIEIALTFTSEELTDLDLWLFADTDDGDIGACTAANPNPPCTVGESRLGVQTFGEERVGLRAADGVYGLAVVPGAVSDPVSAMLRVARDGHHVGWIGPRTVDPAAGLVWLAARLYVVNGTLTIEPLELLVDGLPTVGPAAW